MKPLKLYFNLLPAFGIILIIITAPLVIQNYPGGSITNLQTHGFQWTGNYWCNLYEETALNGQQNTARVRAMVSSSFLSIILIGFFLVMSSLNDKHKIERKIILIFGLLGVLFTPLGMITKYHDIGVILAGSLCSIAVLTILRILKKEKKPAASNKKKSNTMMIVGTIAAVSIVGGIIIWRINKSKPALTAETI